MNADELRFAVPQGGMYLWCELPSRVAARSVQEHAARESVAVLTGEPFFADGGGVHHLRICYTAQPAERAERAAQILARAVRAGRDVRPATQATRRVV